MRFGIADVLSRVSYWFPPDSFSVRKGLLFSPTIRVAEFNLRTTEKINDASRMRMHRLLFAWFKAIFEDADMLIFQENFVILWRRFYWILCLCRCVNKGED